MYVFSLAMHTLLHTHTHTHTHTHNSLSLSVCVCAVDIREIREVREGIGSKDFERQPEELRKLDQFCCFVIYYGPDFKLKTLSVAGMFHPHPHPIPNLNPSLSQPAVYV